MVSNHCNLGDVWYCSINQLILTDSEGLTVMTQECPLESKTRNAAGLQEDTRTRAYKAACLCLTCVPLHVCVLVSLFLPPSLTDTLCLCAYLSLFLFLCHQSPTGKKGKMFVPNLLNVFVTSSSFSCLFFSLSLLIGF